jgi:general secretion pathway protein N
MIRRLLFPQAWRFGNNAVRENAAKFPEPAFQTRTGRRSRFSTRLIRLMLMDAAVAARLRPRRSVAPRPRPAAGGTQMVNWPKYCGLVLLSGGLLAAAPAPQPRAATSSTLDILPSDRAGEGNDTVDLGSIKPISRPNREAVKPRTSGNPLWSIPLSVLTATSERPIFSASRRPPQRAVVAPAVDPVAPPPQKAAEPERLSLALIGAVVGDSDAIAVFLDLTNQKFVRLRQGDSHRGWVLNSVLGREVTLRKAERSEVLALQRQEGPGGGAGFTPIPGPVLQGAGGVVSYAPFTPRSTPKNGESDGL